MSPPGALEPSNEVPHEPGISHVQAAAKKQIFPSAPKFTDKYEEREHLKGRLAAAFRIFGKHGYNEGVAGHITIRDPVEPDTFWVNPFGRAFSQMRRSDLIRVSEHGEVLEGGANRLLNHAAFCIHSQIHQARPDVICAAHSHSIYARTWAAYGKPIEITTQDSCAFYKDHVVYESFNGVVLAEEEGRNVARALGKAKACLLQNHGPLTVGKTVEEAVFWFMSLEKCCRSQLMHHAIPGYKVKLIDDEDAAFTYEAVGTHKAGWFSAQPDFDLIHEETKGDYLN